MPVNQEALLYTLTGFADVFYDFFLGEPKDVTFKYMDQNGDIKTITVANIEKAKQNLEKSAVTDDELANTLKDYYKKVDVDEIRDAIMKNFDNYYKKSEIDSKINDTKTDYINRVTTAKKDLDTEIANTNKTLVATKNDLDNKITVVDNKTVMTEIEYQALAEARRKMYAGSGVVKFGNTYNGLKDPFRFTLKDLWNHSWPGNCDFRSQTDSNKYVYYGETAKVLHWSREGWDVIGGFKNPVFNVNGNRIVIRGVNQSKAFESCVKNVIEFPEAPTVKAVIEDSTSLPVDMEQGDFALLKDLNRELNGNSNFNNGIEGYAINVSSRGELTWDSKNKTLQMKEKGDNSAPGVRLLKGSEIRLIKGVKYKATITFKGMSSGTTMNLNADNNGWKIVKTVDKDGTYEIEFVYNNYPVILELCYINGKDGDVITVSNVSIKQVEEQPIIVLKSVNKNIDIYKYAGNFEARDSISRQDLVFLEVWDEFIEDKNIVYPMGNIQYQGGNVDGVSGITKGTFEGADTYSLFGNWQEPGALIGMGYVWDKLSDEDKVTLASNPDHNIRKKGDKWIQTRYRVRVVKGLGNNWYSDKHKFTGGNTLAYNDGYLRIAVKGKLTKHHDYDGNHSDTVNYNWKSNGVQIGTYTLYSAATFKNYTDGDKKSIHELPLALIQRRNDGVYNKLFNPEGTAQAYDKKNSRLLNFGEYALDDSFLKSLEDCFDISKMAATTSSGSVVPADDSGAKYRSGYIMSKISGHETGLFADEINERDVEDLRMLAKKKPYNEILDEYLQKAIKGTIRGREFNFKIKQQTFWLSSSSSENKKDGGIFVWSYDSTHKQNLFDPYGEYTGKYLLRNGERKNGSFRQFVVEWIDINEKSLGFDLISENLWNDQIRSQKPNGAVGFKVFYKTITLDAQNNIATQTDIIGDPRKLKDRVLLTVTKDDATVKVTHNTYVLCNDSTNNKGSVGHIYRYLGSDLSSIHTNSTDGNANAENGHIDFSDSKVWLDLGDNGNIGGYSDAWLENGFQGVPLVVSEEGESLLPINRPKNYDGYFGTDFRALKIKLSKKQTGDYHHTTKVLVSKKDGGFVEFSPNDGYSKKEYIIDNIANTVGINTKDSYSDLGYASEQEMLDLMQVVVIYNTFANFLENAKSDKVLEINKQVKISGDKLMDNTATDIVSNNLLNKIITTTYGNNMGLSLQTFNKNKAGYVPFTYEYLLHTNINNVNNIDKSQNTTSPMVKYLTYLTKNINRAYLQFVFKEMKFSSDPKLIIKPGIYLNDSKIHNTTRSYGVAYFNNTGELIGQDNFDVFNSEDEATRLTNYLNNIPDNSIIAISTFDEPSAHVHDNKDLKAAMAECGANTDILTNLEYRSSYGLIGIKTGQAQGTKLVESYSPRYADPVRIEYKTDDFIIRVESKGSDSSTTLDKSASWGDDNMFKGANIIHATTDLNGEKILIGQKRVAMPYFITD